MDRIADFRKVFAEVVMARAGSEDARLRQIFATVPRHAFIGPGPWYFTEHGRPVVSDDPALLYQDVAMGLAAERGIPTGQPSLHARCMAACDVKVGEKVVHIGAGSGYFTAILAELVGETGSVTAFEIDPALAAAAARNLAASPQVRVEATTGVSGLPGEVDLIYVNAGVERPPRDWFEALPIGGRMLLPLAPGEDEGGAFLIRRASSKTVFHAELICRLHIVPCVGASDEPTRGALRRAFASGGGEAVRSLRRHPEAADDSAWLRGPDWWLSSRAAVERG